MKLVVDIGPIQGNAYALATALAALVQGPTTNTNCDVSVVDTWIITQILI